MVPQVMAPQVLRQHGAPSFTAQPADTAALAATLAAAALAAAAAVTVISQ